MYSSKILQPFWLSGKFDDLSDIPLIGMWAYFTSIWRHKRQNVIVKFYFTHVIWKLRFVWKTSYISNYSYQVSSNGKNCAWIWKSSWNSPGSTVTFFSNACFNLWILEKSLDSLKFSLRNAESQMFCLGLFS